jgi:hypothetical protein
MRGNRGSLLFAFLLFSSLCLAASESGYITCVRAARSTNGGSLVVFDEELEPVGDGSHGWRPLRTTYEMFSLQSVEQLSHPPNQITAPMAFWEDSPYSWKVVFEPKDGRIMPACPIPILSNDDEYLVLLSQDIGIYPDLLAMQIYKKPSQTTPLKEWTPRGSLIKTITLKELWPGHKFPTENDWTTAPLPQWFAGSTFDFGNTYHDLIYKTPWGDVIHVDLNTGFVSREAN